MKYMVMELHPAYVILMDEEGRFLKAANLGYQVGDTVEDIIELKEPSRHRPAIIRSLSSLAAAAACFCLVFFGFYRPNYMSYGTVRIKINPDVLLTVTRSDRVIQLKGLNADGELLIDGYVFKSKTKDIVADELTDRAIDMGFLSDGKEIRISAASSDGRWKETVEQDILNKMQEHLKDSSITIRVDHSLSQPDDSGSLPTADAQNHTITVPAANSLAPAGSGQDDDDDDDKDDDKDDDDKDDDKDDDDKDDGRDDDKDDDDKNDGRDDDKDDNDRDDDKDDDDRNGKLRIANGNQKTPVYDNDDDQNGRPDDDDDHRDPDDDQDDDKDDDKDDDSGDDIDDDSNDDDDDQDDD